MGRSDSCSLAPLQPNHPESDRLLEFVESSSLGKPDMIPWATFTEPEVARVGLNETEARERNIAHDVTVYGIDDLDRAIADSEVRGMVKVLTVPGKDKILGVTIVGDHAGDIIAEFVLAMRHGLDLNKLPGTIHI